MKIDIGCGTQKKPGFVGIDRIAFPGVDHVCDVGKEPWPFPDESVEEAHSSHMVEHLTQLERVQFANELCRVLKKGATAQIITPYWASSRAYGDMTHQWPPVAESWFPHLNAQWRSVNAPHEQFYTCDFDATFGYSTSPALAGRNQEYVQHALVHWKEAALDMLATLIKR